MKFSCIVSLHDTAKTHFCYGYARLFMVLLLFFVCDSCAPQDSIIAIDKDVTLSSLTSLTQVSGYRRIEGFYQVGEGSRAIFGRNCVVVWRDSVLCLYCEGRGTYSILSGGYDLTRSDTSIRLAGYWRVPTSLETGKIQFTSSEKEIIRTIFSSTGSLENLRLTLEYSNGNDEPKKILTLQYQRPLRHSLDTFAIIAHRAGGRNADFLPAPENSTALAKHASSFGANAIEIDIFLTKDSVPIIYHDEDFNWRLIKTGTLIGPVSDYTFRQVRTLGKLPNGDDIPTLREMLDTVLLATSLNYVWLDIKSPNVLSKALPLLREYNLKARNLNRRFKIFAGIPSQEVYDSFIREPNFTLYPTICELDITKVRESSAEAYAPRWTLGTLLPEVRQMQLEGKRVFVWTLDDQRYIRQYIQEGEFDGILTNYPSIVAYEYLSQE